MSDIRGYRFPGMDPWLEAPSLWAGCHAALVVHMAEALTASLAPRYVALPGRRVVVETPDHRVVPDVALLDQRGGRQLPPAGGLQADPAITRVFEPLEVQETFVEVYDLQRGRKLVTVVEVLSPSNKRSGTDSRRRYLEKQEEILASAVNLVEIDLLRSGEATVAVGEAYLVNLRPHEYRAVVHRSRARDRADVYPMRLRERLARIAVPLTPPDPDAVLDLQALIEDVYRAGGYALVVDYDRPAEPPLPIEHAAWARDVLAGAPAGG